MRRAIRLWDGGVYENLGIESRSTNRSGRWSINISGAWSLPMLRPI